MLLVAVVGLVARGILAVELDLHLSATDVAERPVSYTHLRAHETVLDLVCRLLLEKKKRKTKKKKNKHQYSSNNCKNLQQLLRRYCSYPEYTDTHDR